MNSDKKPFHETVAEKLIKQLSEGSAPWQKPWEPGDAGAFMPLNPTTGKRYKGINALHLMSEGREDQRWMTYKQAAAADAQVRMGEQGTQIQYWKFTEEQTKLDAAGQPVVDGNGAPVRQSVRLERPKVFFATVFNAEQIDGLPPLAPRKERSWNAIERAEQILQASGAVISNGEQDRAFYRPATDSIHLPDKSRFPTADNYYATALHELGHWTGHVSRLDRDLVHPFGSEGYAREELRAEIASMILGDELGIGHDPGQHAAYVGSWIKALQDDPLEIFRAAADAEKIHGYVLGLEQTQVQQQAPVQTVGEAMAMEAEIAPSQEDIPTHEESLPAGRAEAWSLSSIASGTFARAADHASASQLSGMHEVLTAMTPLNTENPFWQRNELPQDAQEVAVLRGKIDAARENVEWRLKDMPVAAARLRLDAGDTPPASRVKDIATFNQVADNALGFVLPYNWTGEVWTEPNVPEEFDGRLVRNPPQQDADAMTWSVYAQDGNGSAIWLANRASEQLAGALEARLKLIDAHSAPNEYEKAAKLARINEERVRRNPDSTDEDIAAAREARKDAEFNAIINDGDLQRRIEFEERQRASVTTVQGNDDAAAGLKSSTKILIDVPYKQKEEAKALGAKWDRQEQSWYVPDGVDVAPFAKWSATVARSGAGQTQPVADNVDSQAASTPTTARQYLAVPYRERAAAKAAGAEWDKAARSWYAGSEADMSRLAKWKPDNVPAQQGPAMTPRAEFAEALRSAGCLISGDHPIMDGKKHRITVEGEKFSKNSGSGFYVGHLDGHPAGYIKNNKTGMDLNWKSKGYVLESAQKALLAAAATAKLQLREAEVIRRQEEAARRVALQMRDLLPVRQPTPYMLAKGIEPEPGAMTDKEGKKTYLPATDANGRHWSMQYIQEDGTKRFAKDSRKEGCFHVVGGLDALVSAPALVICEGYATAVQLKQSLGYATVSAFDSGNLAPVAQALHQKFPDKPVVIAGDDDRHLEMVQGMNPGRTKAEEAARLVGGNVLLPIFAPGENSFSARLESVTPAKYRQHQASGNALSVEQLEALSRMKQFTDFNDLASKSKLGIDGVERQVRAFIDNAIEKHDRSRTKCQQQESSQTPAQDMTEDQVTRRRTAKIS